MTDDRGMDEVQARARTPGALRAAVAVAATALVAGGVWYGQTRVTARDAAESRRLAAEAQREREREREQASRPEDPETRLRLLATLLGQARTERAEGRLAAALASLAKAEAHAAASETARFRDARAAIVSTRGEIQMARWEHAAALESFRTAHALLVARSKEAPGDEATLRSRGNVEHALGGALVQLGRAAEAREAYARAVATRQALLEADPPTARPAWKVVDLAWSTIELSALDRARGDLASAERRLRAVAGEADALAARTPRVDEVRRLQCASAVALARVLEDRGLVPAARDRLRAAVGQLRRLVARSPERPELRARLGRTLARLASLVQPTDAEAAETHLAEARGVFEALLTARADAPDAPDYRAGLADAHRRTGVVLVERGTARYAEARRHYDRALALYETPGAPGARRGATSALASRGRLDARERRWGPALEQLGRAVVAFEKQLDGQPPTAWEARLHHAVAMHELAATRWWAGDVEEARETMRRAVLLLKETLRTCPNVPSVGLRLLSAHTEMGNMLSRGYRNFPEQAGAQYHAAEQVLHRLRRQLGEEAPALDRLAGEMVAGTAEHLMRQGQLGEALPLFERAIELQGEANAAFFTRWGRAYLLAKRGETARAAALAGPLADVAERSGDRFNLACLFAVVGKPDAAVAQLRAIRAWLRTPEGRRSFEAEADFGSLQQHAGFRALVRELRGR